MKHLILTLGIFVSLCASAQKIPISGSIVDSSGAPIQAVTVLEKGTNNGTTTNADGKYSMNVERNAVLVISSVGYGISEIAVAGRAVVDITLSSSITSLSDVVVVAYGTQNRATLTSAQTTISTEDFRGQPVTRLDQVLQGRTSGVQVTSATGAPGADVRIRIRGVNSVNFNNSPLYVIDGFVGGNFNTLTAEDIADIQILKDAAATAPYGSRGANGVIIVTTKRGAKGKANISFSTKLSSSSVKKMYDLLSAGDYAKTVNEYNTAVGAKPFYKDSEVADFIKNGGTDWQKEIYRTVIGQQYDLGISGGSEKTNYYISAGYYDQPGVIINSGFKMLNLRSNINTAISDKFSTYLYFTGNKRENLNTNIRAGTANPVYESIAWSPTVPAYVEDGFRNLVWKDPVGALFENPIGLARNIELHERYSLNTVGGMLYKIIPGLSFNVQVGLSYENTQYKGFSESNTGNSTGRSSGTSLGWQNTNTLHYKRVFNDLHTIDLTAVAEFSEGKGENFGVGVSDIIYPSFRWDNLSLATQFGTPNSSASRQAMASYFGRINYTLAEKYLATLTIRNDKSSVFRGKNQSALFPSVALGWRISEENFMSGSNLIDELKLRGSWGLTGNQAIGPYNTLSSYSTTSATFNNTTSVSALWIGNAGNPDLKWETTEQKNIGLEYRLRDDILHGSFDYFIKDTRDLLFWQGLPMYIGGGSQLTNIGHVRNSGWDFSIGSSPFRSENFYWNTDFNLSYVKNKIIKLIGEGDILHDPNVGWGMTSFAEFILREGESMGALLGLQYLGTWKENEREEATKYGNRPGDSKYADLNNDYNIDTEDNTIIGYTLPKYTAGWNNTINFKGVELNVLLQGVFGFDKLNLLYGASMANSGDARQATHVDVLKRYIPGINETSDIPAFSSTNTNILQSSRFISRGDFLRIKNVSLAYTIPKSFTRQIASIRLFAAVTNLYTFTKYNGMDPETSNIGSGSDAGQNIDYGGYPIPRIITGGITLNF